MPETVSSYYGKDHDRLDILFKGFQILKNSDFDRAKASFREFKIGLQRHIIWEEEVLFPVFEKKVGSGLGPTDVMRKEHRLIGALLEAIHQKVKEHRTDTDTEEMNLLDVLGQHNRKEEAILYPTIDGVIGPEGVSKVFTAMAAISPERYETCCGSHGHDKDHVDG